MLLLSVNSGLLQGCTCTDTEHQRTHVMAYLAMMAVNVHADACSSGVLRVV